MIMADIQQELSKFLQEKEFGKAEQIVSQDPSTVKIRDSSDRLPIHWACAIGCSTEFLQRLLEIYPESINSLDSSGWTPLMISISSGQYKLSKLLLNVLDVDAEHASANTRITALHLACTKSDGFEIAQMLIKKSAKLVKMRDHLMMTPLHRAAVSGSIATIKELINNGAKINATDNEDWTALHHACAEGHYDAAATLIKLGSNAELLNKHDHAPLFYCNNNERAKELAELFSAEKMSK